MSALIKQYAFYLYMIELDYIIIIMLSIEPYHKPQSSTSDVFIPGYHLVPDASQTITSSRLYHEFAVPQHPGGK